MDLVWLKETVFYDVCQHMLQLQAGGTHLLGNKAGCRHAGRSVYLQQIDFRPFGNDVVHTDDALGSHDVIDGRSKFLHAVAQLVGDAGRSNLVRIAAILGIIVEILVVRHHLGDGEDDELVVAAVAAAGDFRAGEQVLDHGFVALHEGLVEGVGELVGRLHFRDAEAASAGVGLDKAGVADAARHAVGRGAFAAAAHKDGVGDVEVAPRERAEVVVERVLVEREGLDEDVARRVRHADEVEVALEDAVFARGAVDGDVGEIERVAPVGGGEAEVVAVDGQARIVVVDVPVGALHLDDVAIVFLSVHKRQDAGCAVQRDVVFGGIASSDNSNSAFHDDFDGNLCVVCKSCQCAARLRLNARQRSRSSAMSGGRGASKSISRWVRGWRKPRVRAWSAWRGQASKQWRTNWR